LRLTSLVLKITLHSNAPIGPHTKKTPSDAFALTETGGRQSMGKPGMNIVLGQRHHDGRRGSTDEILIDEHVVVLAGDHHHAVVGKRHVVALVVLDCALEGAYQLAACAEHRQIEVVVVVGDDHLAVGTNTDPDRVVGHALAADDTEWGAVICKHLNAKVIYTFYAVDEQLAAGPQSLLQCMGVDRRVDWATCPLLFDVKGTPCVVSPPF